MQIDLNADLGEGCPLDSELMPLVTSANVCCGAHAGGPETMYEALRLARRYDVQVGAHPGFADREHFGRRELRRSDEEIYLDCLYQVSALEGLARAAGVTIRYLKPHGALYNLACRDRAVAEPIARAAEVFALPVMGLPDSALAESIKQRPGMRFVAEGFADRRYLPDGSLVPRSEPNAIMDDPQEAIDQVERLISERGIETICVHGDNPQAVAFVQSLREFLTKRGFEIKAF